VHHHKEVATPVDVGDTALLSLALCLGKSRAAEFHGNPRCREGRWSEESPLTTPFLGTPADSIGGPDETGR